MGEASVVESKGNKYENIGEATSSNRADVELPRLTI